jgi:hypothetical protein
MQLYVKRLRAPLDHRSFVCYKPDRAMVASHLTPSMIESHGIATICGRALDGAFFYATYRAWRFS